jgi:hypothetical protein
MHHLHHNYAKLLENHERLQKELLETQRSHNQLQSEHKNTVHFLQQKNEALNKTIAKKNKLLFGFLSLGGRVASPSSSDSSSDEDIVEGLK